MVCSPSLVRSSILNTTQDALFRPRVFSPQLPSLKFLHLVSQVTINTHGHSFSLHPPPCQDDRPSPSSTECNRKVFDVIDVIGGMGVNERVMTSSTALHLAALAVSDIRSQGKSITFSFPDFSILTQVAKSVG